MKTLQLSMLLMALLSFSACELVEHQARTVSCNRIGDNPNLQNLPPIPAKTLCTTDTCVIYQSIWKELFMEKNNLSESYFNAHIELLESNIQKWNDGVSFNICYNVKLGWAVAKACDQFIIKINKQTYPTLNVPRGPYLTKDQIQLVINAKAFSSHLTKVSIIDILKFNSAESAMASLIETSKVNTLCMDGITIDKTTGNLVLEAGAQYDNENNSCISGKIDLISGETEVKDVPCWIN